MRAGPRSAQRRTPARKTDFIGPAKAIEHVDTAVTLPKPSFCSGRADVRHLGDSQDRRVQVWPVRYEVDRIRSDEELAKIGNGSLPEAGSNLRTSAHDLLGWTPIH